MHTCIIDQRCSFKRVSDHHGPAIEGKLTWNLPHKHSVSSYNAKPLIRGQNPDAEIHEETGGLWTKNLSGNGVD